MLISNLTGIHLFTSPIIEADPGLLESQVTSEPYSFRKSLIHKMALLYFLADFRLHTFKIRMTFFKKVV